jgi:glycosyltransferase involved in cell wall biosynthesis
VGSDTLVLADHADDVVAAIVGLLEDPQRARRIGENAAAFVREHFRWENQYEPFDRLLAKKLPEPTDARRVTGTPTINEAGTRPGP